MKISVEVSGRHIHLSQNDSDKLFGKNYKLHKLKDLSQLGEFACEEKVILKNKDLEIFARVVGPVRKKTQVEISASDTKKLEINPPRKISGDLDNSLGIKVIGSQGEVNLKKGVILAKRHIHLDLKSAKELNLKDGQKVSIKILDYVLDDVIVRVDSNFQPAIHIDVDEAVKVGVKKGEEVFGEIIA